MTVLGPGGIGKTRVSVEVARQFFAAHGRAAVFVDLVAIESVPAMMEELARALGGSAGGADPLAAVASAAASGEVLVVLDNLEQLAQDAGRCLTDVLAAAPTVSLLVTSRVALNIAAEQRYLLRPMQADESVALFTARARAVGQRSHTPDRRRRCAD